VNAVLGHRVAAQGLPEETELDEPAPKVEVFPAEPKIPITAGS